MLPNELRMTWPIALTATLGLFWRWLLIGALPGIAVQQVIHAAPLAGFAFQLLISFLGLWIAVKWLFGSGRLGKTKLVLIDQAQYEALSAKLSH